MNRKSRSTKRSRLGNAPGKTKRSMLGADLIFALTTPNVWNQPPVDAQPRKLIAAWTVYRATPRGEPSDRFGLHFVGRDLGDMSGCVSSKIVSFDTTKMCGITRSGRVYQMYGLPAYCSDAEYVLQNWAHINNVDVEDASVEFFEKYALSMEMLKKWDDEVRK